MAIINSSKFLYGQIFDAEAIQLEIEGGEASFLQDNALLAGAAELEIIGEEALFYVGYAMDADPGELVIEEPDALFGYVLDGDPAELEIEPAESLFGYVLEADPGELFLYPEDAGLLYYLAFGNTLNLFIQLLPAAVSQTANQKQKFRILVGAVELDWSDAEYKGELNRIGFELTVQLSNLAQKHLISDDGSYKFEVWDSGVGDWLTVIDTGKLLNSEYGVEWNDGPADTFSFTIYSTVDDKLERSPSIPLELYDSGRVSLDAGDFEVLEDSEGNTYPTTLEAIAGFNTEILFNRVLVDECGFSAVRTNLPHWNLRRLGWRLTDTFWEPIKSKIGMFEPVVFQVGTELWIQDVTQEFTDGMPEPEVLNVSGYKRLRVSRNLQRIGAYEMNFVANEMEYDPEDLDVRIEPDSESTGLIGNANYTQTSIQKYYLDYYKNGKKVREQYEATFKTTTGYSPFEPGVLQTISTFEEQIQYDFQGNQTGSVVVEEAIVPAFSDGTWTYSLQEVSREENGWQTGGHPYNQGQQITKRMTREKSGKIAVDPVNLSMGVPARMSYLKALESHNITEDTTYEDGPIETYEENFSVETRDRIRQRVKKTNHLVGAVPLEYDEPKTGDIGIGGSSTVTKPIIILPNEGDTLDGLKRVEQISMDELPLEYATPLTRRKLRRLSEKPYQFQCDIQGWIVGLRRGLIKTINDRGSEVGKMIIEAFNVVIRKHGEADREVLTTIQGRQV